MEKYIILFSLVLLSSNSVVAQPRKYTNCEISNRIIEPSNSQSYYLSEDCKTAYVLPPATGELKVVAFKSAISESACSGLNAPIDMINSNIERMRKSYIDLQEAEKALSNKYTHIKELQESCRPQEDVVDQLEIQLATVKAQFEALEEEISELSDIKNACAENSHDAKCYRNQREYDKATNKISKLSEGLRKLKTAKKRADAAINICATRRDLQIANIKKNDEEFQKIRADLEKETLEAQKIVDAQIALLESQPGGFMSMHFNSRTQDTVQAFKKLNSNILNEVAFVEMPIKSAVISFQWIQDGEAAGIPIISRSTIRGLEVTKGDRDQLRNSLVTSGAEESTALFKTITSGDMVMNRYAACDLVKKHGENNTTEIGQAIAGLISPMVRYRYNLQVERSIRIKYAESHLYQLIKKSSKKSGLFSSRSAAALTQRSEADKWIDIEFNAEDTDHKFADAEKIMLDIRNEYIDSALMKVAKSYLTQEQVEKIDPGPSVAESLSPALKQVPHLYAQYAAIALDIGSALFGGSTSESNMTRIVKATETQNLRDITAIDEYGSQVFDVRKD